MSLAACHRCPLRHRPCRGPCPCTVDGVPIELHAQAGYCPHPDGPRFGDGVKPEGFEAMRIETPPTVERPASRRCCGG